MFLIFWGGFFYFQKLINIDYAINNCSMYKCTTKYAWMINVTHKIWLSQKLR